MKKILLIIFIVTIFVVSLVGVYLIRINNLSKYNGIKTELANYNIMKSTNTLSQNTTIEFVSTEKTDSVVATELTVSPKAILTIKKEYIDCGHTTQDIAEIPYDMVNLTKKEVQKLYDGWIIEELTSLKVIMYKKVDGICNEHYMLRDKAGYICVYVIDKDNNETEYNETEIATEYLTEIDLSKIKNGIKIIGKAELNKFLEDFE